MPTPIDDWKAIVHLYALCWNERPLLPHFLEHYRSFVTTFFIFDDGSTDGSVEYLAQQPDVVLGCFVRDSNSYIQAATEFYNNIWKASRGSADWVVVVNIDELLHHRWPDLCFKKLRMLGHTLVQATGWEMVATEFPTAGPLAETVPLGVRSTKLDKIAIFDPSALREIDYAPGRHSAKPRGVVHLAVNTGFHLLHFKHLGFDYLSSRYAELESRRGEADRIRNQGSQYALPVDVLRERQKRLEEGRRPVLIPTALRSQTLRKLFDGCFLIKARDVRNARGGLREVWTHGEDWGAEVRHIYLTTTLPGVVKAWYYHDRQIDHVTVISGAVRFALWDARGQGSRRRREPVVVEMRAENAEVLIIPNRVWHGFQTIGDEPVVLLHHNDSPYDWTNPDEEKLPIDAPEIPYRWGV